MNVGRMLFYDKVDGAIIVDTGEWANVARKKTVEEQIATYKYLSERNRETFDVTELEYGAYARDFAVCSSFRVNITTKKLEFSYPDPNKPGIEQPYQIPLTEQVEELQQAQQETNATLLEFMEASLLT